MDKLEILLDMIEHPERYTEQQITDLLADEEMRKHYDVMVRLRGAYDVKKVKSERVKSEKYILPEESDTVHERNSHSSFFILHSSFQKIAAVFIVVAFLGGLAWAFVPLLRSQHTAEPTQPTKVSAPSLQGRAGGGSSISFSNLRLDSILTIVAAHYECEVCFRDTTAQALRLSTVWDREDSLSVFLETLNEFDGLRLMNERDTIFVESLMVEDK